MSVIIESSALGSLVKNEDTADTVREVREHALSVYVPVHCLLEITLAKRLPDHRHDYMERLLNVDGVTTIGVAPDCWPIMRDAARRYGKGAGHPAKLNFGDCLSYAVSKQRGVPLLFVGLDFIHTDGASAIDWTTA